MSDVPPRQADDKTAPVPEQPDESLIVNPIKMARARHALAHSQSVVEETAQAAAQKPPEKRKPAVTTVATPAPTGRSDWSSLFSGGSGCLIVLLVGGAFLLGGLLGGLAGGSLLLSMLNSDEAAAAAPQNTPTSLPVSTPTPALVETMTPTPTLLPSPTPAMEDIIAGIIPSVVTVINEQHHNSFAVSPEDSRVVGSGVIVDGRGYIATNHHVIENPGNLRVVLADGRDFGAELVVSDPSEDLAIVKISGDNLTAINWGDSTTVRPGQAVYAIGSPLGDFPSSVSFGVVSGLNRALEMNEFVIDGLIQTDAAINRGSSGGPLINSHGEMIGINTFIIRESEDRGVAEGIAFALPTNMARDMIFPWIAAHSGDNVAIPAAEEPGGN